MQLKVKDMGNSGSDFDDQVSLQAIDIDGIKIVQNINVSGTAYRSNEDVIVKLRVVCVLSETCDRCLEDFECTVDGYAELFYQPYKYDSPVTFKDLDADDLGTLYYKNNTIDLIDAIRDTIVLERPLKIICKDSCLGLCSFCGSNKNISKCQCVPKKNNPFAELLKKNE